MAKRQRGPEEREPEDTQSVLPMDLRAGDRFTDQGFEWEVVTTPKAMHGAKNLRARIVRPGVPETERDMIWAAHERVEIRRCPAP